MRPAFPLLTLACLLAGACDAPKRDARPVPVVSPAAVPSAEPAARAALEPSSQPAVAPSAVSAPCDRPELWLALYPREQLSERYCATCAQQSSGACDEDGTEQGPRLAWELLHQNDQQIASRYSCSDLAYLALAIGALHGEPVEDPFWKPYFQQQSWYRPDGQYDSRSLPAAATANRRWIEGRRDACLKSSPPVSEGDWKAVSDWFAAKAAGKPQLPAKLFLDGKPTTPKAFTQFITSEGLFDFDPRTPVRYDQVLTATGAVGGDRTVVVPTGDPGLSCLGMGEMCEGYEWLEITFDRQGRIVALGASAAACPFVYAASGQGRLVFQGEILRNLRRPELATTQTLALASISSCSAPIRVRLSEEKAETSFVDSVALLVDGLAIAPDACRFGGATYCKADGVHHVMRQGEWLDLSFTPPPDVPCSDLRLQASGYYVPGV